MVLQVVAGERNLRGAAEKEIEKLHDMAAELKQVRRANALSSCSLWHGGQPEILGVSAPLLR